MQGVQVQSLVEDLRSHMPHSQKTKHETSNILTNSIMTLKMVHIKKKKLKERVNHNFLVNNNPWLSFGHTQGHPKAPPS